MADLTWRSKISALLRSTENNLQHVKKSTAKIRSDNSNQFGCESIYCPEIEPLRESSNLKSVHTENPGWKMPSVPSSLLIDKVTSCEGTIQSLLEAAGVLQQNNAIQARRIDKLEESQRKLIQRLNEKGIDYDTEDKMNQWKSEIESSLAQRQSFDVNKNQISLYSHFPSFDSIAHLTWKILVQNFGPWRSYKSNRITFQ